MWKKFLCALTAVLTAAVLAFPCISASAEQTLRKGDTVRYIFTVGQSDNIAGIAVDSFYNAAVLELSGKPEFLIGGQGMTNTNNPGRIKWNTMINGGRDFDNEDILVETFTVTQKCTLEDAALSFSAIEVFTHDLETLPLDLISARVEIDETGTDDDESDTEPKAGDTDITSDTDSDSEESKAPSNSEETSSVKPVVIISTDFANSDDDEEPEETAPSQNTTHTPSRTVSSRPSSSSAPSSATSSKPDEKTSDKPKTETETSPDSKPQSSAPSSSVSKASSSVASKTSSAASQTQTNAASASSSRAASTVPTAGRIVIAALAALFAAAGAVVLLTKKIKTTDQ